MDRVRVVVADDNAQLRETIQAFLCQQEGIEVLGTAANGIEAIKLIEESEPDVLICDMIMPQMDGYAVLERLSEMNLKRRPGVIALTALGRDDFVARAVNLGVCYYMIKPFDYMLLTQRVYEAAGAGIQAERIGDRMRREREADPAESLEERIANLFLTVGIPAHIKGYQYLREAVKMVIDNPDLMGRITKELYPGIAHRFGTTSSKVERAIRHAIEVAWNRGRIEALDEAFGRNVCSLDDKPTNGEFIALVSDRLRIKESA
ncbi:MAG: sporulation transcription factor Spo0A [Clostridia bacterium]|nr:sporulation transcription factor Spo0A [Clostridia bacterium]MBQ4609832.1 sporulation transcription factor Spo0A [Clostridia bacterium]MBQ7052303.1 sporulation transcription factor Spo0A [Clostridia bacterium]